jgi:ceramide glucosyltransferase
LLTYSVFIAAVAALVYQLAALLAAARHMARRDPAPGYTPPVSILKPVRGLDPHFREALGSHAGLDYPTFEILVGVADPGDPAVPEVRRLIDEHPGVPMRLIVCRGEAPNRKVAVLEALAAEASHPVLLVNDGDIHVPRDYLRRVVAPLAEPDVGLVTCLYRGLADTWPARLEALGIATDFAPSVLVAPLAGVREFGLGSTLAFRAEHLRAIGGFAAIAGFLADDYQLARRITGLGLRVHLSKTVVATTLAESSWRGVWKHQVRWHRTIRVSKGLAYWGITVTQATFWALAAAAAGWWTAAGVILAVRLAAGLLTGLGVLRCPVAARLFWLMPVRDLGGFAVWIAGLMGKTVEWRGRKLRLTRDGRIVASDAS